MRNLFALALFPLAIVASAQTPPLTSPAPEALLPPDQAAMKAHVLFLASDAMRGREAGSREYDIAAQYVAAQFYAAGLKPGGDAGRYLQRVPLVSYRLDGDATVGWTPRAGAAVALKAGEDFTAAANPARAETRVGAPVVFVGYGIDAPRFGLTSYRGADVRGKIVAVVAGAPASLGGEERAFFGSPQTKAMMAAAKGAVGLITVQPRPAPPRPLAAPPRGPVRMTWATPDGVGKPDPIPMLGMLTATGGAKLFGADWAKITAAAQADAPRYKPVTARGVLSVQSRTAFEKAESSNVVGLLPGSDPKLRHEVVVLSAHLDHIGVGKGATGDQINNGALDNAIGIASLIEEAKRFARDGNPPRRTLMFLAVTAEEKGLVGADYFANHPTVPLPNIVADVNLDMPILTYAFTDMIVYGGERSTLGPIIRQALASEKLTVSADPIPEEGIFVRSDHFRFVQKGVPSVFLWPGQGNGGKEASARFMSTCYHRPCDEVTGPILWDQGPRFVAVNYAIARGVADADARPVWNKGDYFGTLFKGPMAKPASSRRP
jgi:Zn-dependent M28 family amino/carboxypeptidase